MITKTYSFEANGKINDVYTLKNGVGAEVDILTYGARLIRISVPDKNGAFSDVLVGCKTPEDYCRVKNHYCGATVGRYANRIGGAAFLLNGERYELEANNGENSLHGGITTKFDIQTWDAEIAGNTLVLSHFSPDGAGGYPGNLSVKVFFTLTEESALVIEYAATTDKDTVCNFTNHSYFNIGGQATVLSHELWLKSKKLTPVDENLIPHGEYMNIEDTPYSFMPAKALGADMFSDAKFIAACKGYDFNYCIDREGEGLEHFASVYDRESGRKMDCYTTLPGVQLYTACKMGGFVGKRVYENYCALCLETQSYPNSPNCPEYPSTLLKAGETYRSTTVYKFSVVK